MQTYTLESRGVSFARGRVVGAASLVLLLFLDQTIPILGNPTGGTVVAGSATIGPAGQTLTINQGSSTAIINWQQFSIAGSETTKFLVPGASSATLNRVLGGNPSAIYGTLQSNGILYLINPSGIVVGPNGYIDTAGFLGSTLDISNEEFLKRGNLHFLGTSDAGIENQGTIHASSGDVYLIARQVTNSGQLLAPGGNVGLAAGTDILYQTAGDQHLFIQPTPAGTKRALGMTNAGTIRAGSAELKAAGGNAYALAINNTGTIAASGYKKIHGQVYLTADGGDINNSGQISANAPGGNGGTIVLDGYGTSAAGTVLNSGKLIAAGKMPGAIGGTVEVLGNRVGVTDQGVVDVSGDAGGGTALIGGDEHGANPAIPDAAQTYLGPDATVTAAALTAGNGGKVILWGDQTTQAYGKISVTGGAQGGNGGFVETSAPSLDLQTVPDTSAPHGSGGTWLLDPSSIIITDGPDVGGDMTQGFTTSPPFTSASTTLDASGSAATLNQTDLLTALVNGNVTLDASSGSGGAGTITWSQPNSEAFDISSIPGHTLTLDAPTAITLSDITINSVANTGSLNLTLNSSLTGAGTVLFTGSTIDLHGGTLTANGNGYISAINQNYSSNGVFVYNSQINAQGGDVDLTGNGGYNNAGSGITAGIGVLFANDGTHTNVVQTTGTGNINVIGTFNQNLSFAQGVSAVNLDQSGNSILAQDGLITVKGTISAGNFGNSTSAGGFSGILVFQGSSIEATGDGGSIKLTGNVQGATAYDSGTSGSGADGVQIGAGNGTGAGAIISIATNGTITIKGTGGAVDSTYSTSQSSSSQAVGVEIGNGTQLSAGVGSNVSITGFGGSASSTGPYKASAEGVKIGGGSQGQTPVNLSVTTGGNLSITGTGGMVNTTSAPATTGTNVPGTEGVAINHNSDLSATDTGTITLMGTGGTITAGTNEVGESFGVSIAADSKGAVTISSISGLIQITGTGGSSPNLGAGVVLDGLDDELATVKSQSGNIEISGTGGTGYVAEGNYSIPSHGVGVVDNVLIQTGGSGTISLTGTGTGAEAYGVSVEELPSGSFDTIPELASISAGGAFTATALSATGVYLSGNFTAASATLGTGTAGNFSSITSGTLEISNSTFNLAGGNLTAFGAGVISDPKGDENNVDGIDIISSTIDTDGGSANLTGQAAYFLTGNQGNAAGSGIYISDTTLATALVNQNATTGGITIQGNGSLGSGVSATTDLAGVYFDASTVSVINGALSITGDVNSGTAAGFNSGSGYSGSGYVRGVYIRDGTLLESTGSGSVSITGDTTSSSAQIANLGVDLSGEGFGMNGPDPVVTSTISATGGLGVTIMGTAGAVGSSPSGMNVQTPSTAGIVVEFGADITATGSAPITLTGTGGDDQNLASDNLTDEGSRGISLEAYNNGGGGDSSNILIQSAGGAISLTGTAGSSIGSVAGIHIDSDQGASSTVQSVSVSGAPSGNITLKGMVPNENGVSQGTSLSGDGASGVSLNGDPTTGVYGTISAALGSVSITGTVSSGSDNTEEAGVIISGGSQVSASGTGGTAGATAQGDVTISGDARGSTAESLDGGVFIDGAGTMVNATGVVADASGSTGLTITGFSSEIDGTTGATIDQGSNNTGGVALQPVTGGIGVINGAEIATSSNAPLTLNGTGALNDNTLNSTTSYADPTTGATSGSYGVLVFSPVASQTTTISSGGALSITGQAGSSPTTGIGVMLGGSSNLGAASVTSASSITLNGTAGTGNNNTAGVVPNAGVGIFDAKNSTGQISLTANGGNLAITGDGVGTNPIGVVIEPYASSSSSTSLPPILGAPSGALDITATAGGIIFNADAVPMSTTFATSATFIASTYVDINGPISDVRGLLLVEAPLITLNAAITSNDGNTQLVDTTQFVNNDGASALTASNGHTWQVWSVNPPGSGQSTVDVDGGLTPNFIQYDATYGTTTPAASGNGLLYSYDPSALAVTLNGTFTKTYNDTQNLTITAGSYTYSASGLISGDSIGVSGSSPLNGTLNSKDVSTATTVTVIPSQINFAVTHGGISVYGYTIGSASGAATVTPATLTGDLIGTVSKVYDSTTAATLGSPNYNLGGVFNGDNVILNDPASGTYNTKDVGTGKTVTVTGLALSGTQAGDYMLGSTSVSGAVGTITVDTLTAALTGTVDKTYDATTTASLTSVNYSLPGVFNGDTVTLNDPASGSYDTATVGTGKTVTVSGLSISGTSANDYALASTTISGPVGEIDAAMVSGSLTPTLIGTVTKVYDGTFTVTNLLSSNYMLTGVMTGDSVTLTGPTTGTYTSKDVGTGIMVTSSTGLVLSGPQASNYTLDSTTASGAIGIITVATLTADLIGTVSKAYDSTTTALLSGANYGLAGIFGSDHVTLTGPTSGTYASKDVGTGITVTSGTGLALTGAQASDYMLGNSTASGAVGTITAATLTPSLTGTVSKVYNSTTAATLSSPNYNLGGVFNGDNVVLNDPASGTYNTKDVGTGKTVTVTGLALSGTQAGDYMLGSTSVSGAVGTITQATLTASLTGTVSKVYDGTTVGTLNPANISLPGVFTGDSVGVSGTESYGTQNVGVNEAVTVSGLALTGASAADYQLSPGNLSANIGTITTAPLTITANNAAIMPGDPLPSFSVSYSNFVPGESASVLNGMLVFQTPATSNSTDGNYPVTPSGVSDSNYQIQFVPGTLTIGTVSTSPVTTTGGDNGSNKFPPAITPQPIQTGITPPPTGNSGPSPVTYTGTGIASQVGQQGPGLADSTGNGGQVGSGDTAQLGNGELSNTNNPVASGTLNEALGPAVHAALSDALKDAGDLTTDFDGSQDNEDLATKKAKHQASDETTLNGGDVVSIGNDGVKNIPLNQAPQLLKDALAGDILNGMPAAKGH